MENNEESVPFVQTPEYKKNHRRAVVHIFLWWGIPLIILIVVSTLDYYLKWNFVYNQIHKTINIPLLTLFIACLSLAGYSVRQKMQLIASNIAKSRVEWIGMVRVYLADYMSATSQAYNFGKKHPEVFSNPNQLDASIEADYRSILQNAERTYYLLMFSFNPGDSLVKNLNDYLQVASNRVEISSKREHTQKIGQEIQRYLNREWIKAKFETQYGIVYKESKKGRTN